MRSVIFFKSAGSKTMLPCFVINPAMPHMTFLVLLILLNYLMIDLIEVFSQHLCVVHPLYILPTGSAYVVAQFGILQQVFELLFKCIRRSIYNWAIARNATLENLRHQVCKHRLAPTHSLKRRRCIRTNDNLVYKNIGAPHFLYYLTVR